MPVTLRAAMAGYWAQILADPDRPATFRLVCARQLAHLALVDWDSTDRRRRAAARAAGAALLRLIEQLPVGHESSPPVDGGPLSTAGEYEGNSAGAADLNPLRS